jgi:predicted nucleic-acid-binding protein
LIGLDTNILLRAALDDDPVQSLAAQSLLSGLNAGRPGFINIPVLMEFFWVLRSRYKLPKAKLASAIRELVEAEHLEFEELQTVATALAAYEAGQAEFADIVIALRNQELGVESTFTFDKRAAARVSGMKLLA